ncbi:hypothetical protein [Poseidonibacter ostreae]|uniref:Uncharacterized protein n=1 Tax=Poseidonibacter ostreae TaxID=2654171 RepID=A0A6L4WWZ1_9BACT|nr:hypothetical protein [Poseidonibacter ostreae]KAB7891401.1 hypothetical protein GBG19_00765 [Poseidonibacter ostreae]
MFKTESSLTKIMDFTVALNERNRQMISLMDRVNFTSKAFEVVYSTKNNVLYGETFVYGKKKITTFTIGNLDNIKKELFQEMERNETFALQTRQINTKKIIDELDFNTNLLDNVLLNANAYTVEKLMKNLLIESGDLKSSADKKRAVGEFILYSIKKSNFRDIAELMSFVCGAIVTNICVMSKEDEARREAIEKEQKEERARLEELIPFWVYWK